MLEPEIIDAQPTAATLHEQGREPPKCASAKPFPWGCVIGGCLTSMLLMFALLASIGIGGYRFFKQQIAQNTSTEPRQLPVVELSPEELKEIDSRIDTFQKKVNQGKAPDALVLTADEINALIGQQEKLRGHVFIKIEDGLIQADVSFPADELPGGKGRFFNGSARLSASIENGELVVKLDRAELGDQPLSEGFMKLFRGQNLAKDMNNNPEFAKKIAKFERLEIQGDKLILTPKEPPVETVPQKENESSRAP